MKTEHQQKHYLYKVTLLCGPKKGYYYYGKHTTKKGRNPDSDIYWGSGTIVKSYIKKYGAIEGVTLHKEILEYNATMEENNRREEEVIGDKWKTEPMCLNLKAGGTTGAEYSEEARAKISKALKGYKHSEESRKHMSIGHIGQKAWNKGIPMDEEQRKKFSEINKGRKHTQEWKDNMSKIMKGRPGKPCSEEKKQYYRELYKGSTRSEESRRKQSETLKGRKLPAEWAQHIGDGHRGFKHTDESLEKMRNTTKNDAVIRIMSDGTKEWYRSKIEASRQTKVNRQTICRSINNNSVTKSGDRWLAA